MIKAISLILLFLIFFPANGLCKQTTDEDIEIEEIGNTEIMIDVHFVLDSTGSMRTIHNQLVDVITDISEKLSYYDNISVSFGFTLYRDKTARIRNQIEIRSFPQTVNKQKFFRAIREIKAYELDWEYNSAVYKGLIYAAEKAQFRNKSHRRLIVHIGDSHDDGNRYDSEDVISLLKKKQICYLVFDLSNRNESRLSDSVWRIAKELGTCGKLQILKDIENMSEGLLEFLKMECNAAKSDKILVNIIEVEELIYRLRNILQESHRGNVETFKPIINDRPLLDEPVSECLCCKPLRYCASKRDEIPLWSKIPLLLADILPDKKPLYFIITDN